MLVASQRPATVPMLWPDRTAGAQLRLAWLMPAPGLATFDAARKALDVVAQAMDSRMTLLVLCSGDAEPQAGDLLPHLDGSV